MMNNNSPTRPDEGKLFLTEAEAAAALRVHPSTLGRLATTGRSPVTPIAAGSRRLYPAAAIEALAHPRSE